VLVIIGPGWLSELGDGHDHVRAEVAAALDRNLTVIPVLVGGARMPAPHELPVELAPLTRRASLEVTDAHFDYDVQPLIAALTPVLAAQAPEVAPRRSLPDRPHELERMLVQAARAGIVPAEHALRREPRGMAVDRVEGEFRHGKDFPPLQMEDPLEAPQRTRPGVDEPSYRPEASRRRMEGPPREAAPPWPSRSWKAARALILAALAGGIGYLIADRLLGLVLEPPEARSEPTDDVACTVFAPPEVKPGQSFLVQTFVHLPEQADDARALALEMDTDAARRVFRSLEAPIPRGGRLHFELRAPGLAIDDSVTSLVWQGRPQAVQFGVTVPPGASGTVIATLFTSLESAPLGHVKFKIAIDSASAPPPIPADAAETEPQGERACRYRAAFISYASKDRDKVLQRVQMLPLVGVRYFQDVLDLEPGDRWSRRLELGIDECDLFLLFWSSEAKCSKWVRQEVRHALKRRGGDDLAPPEIKPVIIEGPPVIEPWVELAHLHFNDRVAYFMKR
jgi:TIR domain